jgi:hypothetical protein
VIAKVEFHAGELFPRVVFIVTNLELPSRAVVRFYNKRGTAEQWIKEGKQAVTRLSCDRFRCNEVRPALGLLAYSLGNLWRRLALPSESRTGRLRVFSNVCEDRRTVGQARPVLLAATGREPSEPAAVRGDAGADRTPASSDGIGDVGPVCRRIGL